MIGRGADGLQPGSELTVKEQIVATGLAATNPPPPQTNGVYDLSTQFSAASNPAGVWSYGWESSLGGGFTLLTNYVLDHGNNGVGIETWYFGGSGPPAVYHNGTTNTVTSDSGAGNFPPGSTWFYAGPSAPQNYGAIRFTVPSGGSGVYALSTSVQSYLNGSISGDTDFHVVWNGLEVFDQFLPGNGGANFAGTIALSAGDTVDFLSGRGADNNLYGSGLKIAASFALTNGLVTITTNPPPPPQTNGVYNLSTQFSPTSNPDGAWSYGWEGTNRATFTPYGNHLSVPDDHGLGLDVWDSYPGSSEIAFNPSTNTAVLNGGQQLCPPGSVWCAAGAPGEPDYFATVRFTVPPGGDGSYSVAAGVKPAIIGSLAGAYEFRVDHNGVEIFGQALGATQGANFSNLVTLVAGDTIDLLVGRGTNATASGAEPFLNATITLIAAATNTPTPPVITVEPASQSVTVGQSVTLGVTATGSGPLEYQWYAGAAGNSNSPIPGATNATFSPGQLYSSQSFWVSVENGAGSADSTTATVTVNPVSQPSLSLQLTAGLPFITIEGLTGTSYRIQYSSNLAGTNWTTLFQLSLPSSSFTFSDTSATNSFRFYRAVTP